jgi:beta-lactamase regulating signal transducer with metallopeptidase domain
MSAFPFEMAWKSSLIAGVGMALAATLRMHPASRVDALRLVFVTLLLLPLVSLAGPGLSLRILPAHEPATGLGDAPTDAWFSSETALGAIYLAGVLAVFGRCASGLWMLRVWARSAEEIQTAEWAAALAQIRASDARLSKLRLAVSRRVSGPLSWGARDPIILIDQQTLSRPGQARAILAHEAAHILRADWCALMLMNAIATLFWFNPLVWLLKRAAQQCAGEAADLAAVQTVNPASYAQILLDCAQRVGQAALVANGIASGTQRLAKRVRALLDGSAERRRRNWTSTGLVMTACAAFCLPVAALHAEPMSSAAAVRSASPLSMHIAASANRAAGGGALRTPVASFDGERGAARAEELALPENERRLAIEGRALAERGRLLAAQGRAMAAQGRADAARAQREVDK